MKPPKPRMKTNTPSSEEQHPRDELLRRLLKTPPQPRPKRERGKKSTVKKQTKEKTAAK